MKGKVKWYSVKKGFGFITDENNNDIFVHWSGINMEGYKYLKPGKDVTFDLGTKNDKTVATNVTVIKETVENG